MSSRIVELYGAPPLSSDSVANATKHQCPFVAEKCFKKHGACSLQVGEAEPVIICPNRLYAGKFEVLLDVAKEVFGGECELVSPHENETRRSLGALTGKEIIVFGKYFGGELGIPSPSDMDKAETKGSFYIDFLLAKFDASGNITAFAAVEVQTIDTTNSYAKAAEAYSAGKPYSSNYGPDLTKAGLNWENVTKRILPQLIYKGHALRREPLCVKGLFFIVPHAVFLRIKRRVGGKLQEYPQSAGAITFRTYDLGPVAADGARPLVFRETLTTTVDQIAYAFVSPQNLPDAGVYQSIISQTVAKLAKKKKSKKTS